MTRAASILLAGLLALAGAGDATAQTPAGAPPGHAQMGGPHAGHPADRDMRHTFGGAEIWAREFDDPARDAWQKPEQVLDALGVQRTSRVADLGAGTGYFSARIAKRVPEGKVFAVDIEPDMIRYLAERRHREHLAVLTPVQATADSANLPEPVDIVLIVDTYHHLGDRVAYFAKLAAALRPGGRLAIVDFKAGAAGGPLAEQRVSPDQVTAELAAAGYALVAAHDFLPRQFFLVFQRKPS